MWMRLISPDPHHRSLSACISISRRKFTCAGSTSKTILSTGTFAGTENVKTVSFPCCACCGLLLMVRHTAFCGRVIPAVPPCTSEGFTELSTVTRKYLYVAGGICSVLLCPNFSSDKSKREVKQRKAKSIQ